jgi:Domain of unknown function (DUF1906)
MTTPQQQRTVRLRFLAALFRVRDSLLSRRRRWKAVVIPLVALAVVAAPLAGMQPAKAVLPGPVVVNGEGFDTSSLPPTGDMADWWSTTPYWAIGVYIGGENYSGTSPDHAWLASVMTEGWDTWLIWVGPQSACVTDQPDDGTFSNDPTTAQDEGETQAQDAVAAASADGFSDEYIVYDLEGYDTDDSTCLTAAQSFVNGFEYEVHTVLGEHGGLYGSTCGSDLSAYTAHSNIPEAIYPADYGYSDYATTPLQCVPDDDWDHNQRVHQWSGDTDLRFDSGDSGPGWVIDEDCLDGPAQGDYAWDKSCS